MKVVTVADIATPAGRRITQSALTLKHGNRLCDHYDRPRSPPDYFREDYAELWKEALNKTLILQQGGPNNRTLHYRNWLGPWMDPNILDRWEWVFSPAKDRVYQRVDSERRAWGSYSGRGERGRYSQTAFQYASKPESASLLISVSSRGAMIKRENTQQWAFIPTDDNLATYDPAVETFACILTKKPYLLMAAKE